MQHSSEFTIELLQAISDWQRGGDVTQKKRRGLALKSATRELPASFKSAGRCFRQIALDDSAVWRVGTQLQLSETISAWTDRIEIAKDIKGGVPPVGYQGVIFVFDPAPCQVIVNLAALYRDEGFRSYMNKNESSISGYWDGAGGYGDSQSEVVIEAEFLPLDSVHAWGGYAGPELQLAHMYYGHTPSEIELQNFRELMTKAGHSCGPYWLSTPEAVSRVAEKLKYHGERLSNGGGGTKGDILNFLRRPREVLEITQNVPLNLRRLVLSRRPVLESKFAE
ncbi:MAG: hypothetical protein Q7U76_17160 [Nitrospirota bacterium]|nr:hypothetical protein [Nitrospirota bacterium]